MAAKSAQNRKKRSRKPKLPELSPASRYVIERTVSWDENPQLSRPVDGRKIVKNYRSLGCHNPGVRILEETTRLPVTIEQVQAGNVRKGGDV